MFLSLQQVADKRTAGEAALKLDCRQDWRSKYPPELYFRHLSWTPSMRHHSFTPRSLKYSRGPVRPVSSPLSATWSPRQNS